MLEKHRRLGVYVLLYVAINVVCFVLNLRFGDPFEHFPPTVTSNGTLHRIRASVTYQLGDVGVLLRPVNVTETNFEAESNVSYVGGGYFGAVSAFTPPKTGQQLYFSCNKQCCWDSIFFYNFQRMDKIPGQESKTVTIGLDLQLEGEYEFSVRRQSPDFFKFNLIQRLCWMGASSALAIYISTSESWFNHLVLLQVAVHTPFDACGYVLSQPSLFHVLKATISSFYLTLFWSIIPFILESRTSSNILYVLPFGVYLPCTYIWLAVSDLYYIVHTQFTPFATQFLFLTILTFLPIFARVLWLARRQQNYALLVPLVLSFSVLLYGPFDLATDRASLKNNLTLTPTLLSLTSSTVFLILLIEKDRGKKETSDPEELNLFIETTIT